MRKCGLSACVVNLSGGVDSAVTLGLMHRAATMEGSPIKRVVAVAQPIHRFVILLTRILRDKAGPTWRTSRVTSSYHPHHCPANLECFLHMAWTKRVFERTGAAASVACRRRERLARAGRAMRARRSDTRAASQAFERMHRHVSTWRKHTILAVVQCLPFGAGNMLSFVSWRCRPPG
jgi:hypothetical protein